MGKACNRSQVVLAKRLERDIAERDNFIVASGLVEGPLKHRLGIFIVTLEPFFVGTGYSGRRSPKALPPGVVSSPGHKDTYGFLGLPLRRFQLVDFGHKTPCVHGRK